MPRRGDRRWHEALLPHPEVARWHSNLKRRNETTADVYLRRLARTLHHAKGMTPMDLLKLDQEQLEDAVTDCIDYELSRGMLGSTVMGFLKAVKSFLDWHGREVKRKNHIPNAHEYPLAEATAIPSQDQLRAVLKTCNARTAAMLVLVAHGGLRLQVIGNIDATDGLRLRDLPELKIEGGAVEFEKVPAKVSVPKALSKNGSAFFTFLGPEACDHVLAYLRWRNEEGEELGPDSPLITPYGGSPRFTLRNNIGDAIRRAMRSAGVDGRPYIWRSYFANRCLLAESKGLLSAYRRFFMGHAGDIQTRYSLRKQLPEDAIEDMRAAYQKALPYLESSPQSQEDPTPKMAALILQSVGYTEEELQGMDLASRSEDEIVGILRERFSQSPATLSGNGHPGACRQKVVSMDEIEGAIQEGWAFKASLPDGRAIVEM